MKNLFKIVLVCLTLILTVNCLANNNKFKWPGNTCAAICLTYDEGTESQLKYVVPVLDNAGLRGTCYLQGDKISPENLIKWRNISTRGHELVNHSCFHPCSENFDWVWPEFATEKYTIPRMLKELLVMNTLLFAIDGKEERTFAYPCSELIIGGKSYVDSLRNSNLFIAARSGAEPSELNNMSKLDVFNVPSWAVNEHSGTEMIAEVVKTVKRGTLLVFMFHGVGGDYLKVSKEAHQELIEYSAQNKDTIWTAPFIEVMKHIISERKRLGWDN